VNADKENLNRRDAETQRKSSKKEKDKRQNIFFHFYFCFLYLKKLCVSASLRLCGKKNYFYRDTFFQKSAR
jgi:hypothetical protein